MCSTIATGERIDVRAAASSNGEGETLEPAADLGDRLHLFRVIEHGARAVLARGRGSSRRWLPCLPSRARPGERPGTRARPATSARARVVTTIRRSGHSGNNSAIVGAAGSTCSKLSRMSSISRLARARFNRSSGVAEPNRVIRLRDDAMRLGTSVGSLTVSRMTRCAPSLNLGARRWPSSSASLLFPMPTGTGQRDQTLASVGEQPLEVVQIVFATDERVRHRGQVRLEPGCCSDRLFGCRLLFEALREQEREIVAQVGAEFLGGPERAVRDAGVRHPFQQLGQPGLPFGGRLLDVDQPRHGGRQLELVLQAREVHVRRRPPVALPVDPDEDIALFEVRPIEIAWRVRASAHLEEDRMQVHVLDRGARRRSLCSQFLHRGTDEDPESLVWCPDRSRRHHDSFVEAVPTLPIR